MVGYQAEANQAYFDGIYQNAVDLTALLCREYSLDPLEPGVVICHAEGYDLGIASQHGDVLQWWPKHGVSMDQFRRDVSLLVDPVKISLVGLRLIANHLAALIGVAGGLAALKGDVGVVGAAAAGTSSGVPAPSNGGPSTG